MINIKDYRLNPQKYQIGAQQKWVTIDWPAFEALDAELKMQTSALETLLARRNSLSKDIEHALSAKNDPQPLIQEVKILKQSIESLQRVVDELRQKFDGYLYQIPVPALSEVPVGQSDQENVVVSTVWDKPLFTFTPRPHREILDDVWLLDQERAVKLSWSRFQIMKGQLARLELALVQWAVDLLTDKWFTFVMVPQLVKEDALRTTGFLPNDAMNIYRVNPAAPHPQDVWEEDDLYLIGTAEVALVSQHMHETFTSDQLPRRYVWFSSCYRREAGTYWKDTKWLIRVHQFEKVEMVSFVHPDDSHKEHEFLVALEEEVFQALRIPYQKLLICTWDLGAPAAKKYDLEAWFPWIGRYIEVTSTSNTLDFQTRRGEIKVATDSWPIYAHALNGTAVALGRALAAIVENYQQEDGTVLIPEVLRPYMRQQTHLF
jgi:seryl-tRNA synthetase